MRTRINHPGRTLTRVSAAGAGGLALGLAGLAVATTASATAPPASDAASDVDSAAIAADIESAEISTFVDAAGSSTGAIADSEPPFTVFIPLNSAFDALPDGVVDAIFADADLLGSLLDYHLIPGQVLGIADLAEAGTVDAASGEPLEFALDGDALTINGGAATVVCPDVVVDDAMLQIVDSLLQPPSMAGGGGGGTSVPGSSAPASSVPAFDPDQQAVATAWETATDSSLTFDEQAPFIEDAESLRATIEAYPAAADVVNGISTIVQTVVIDGDTATITYAVAFNGVEQPYPAQEASLVRVDGEWIVPQAELCVVYSYARNACPA